MKITIKSLLTSTLAFVTIGLTTSCQDELYNNPSTMPGALTPLSVYLKGGPTVQSYFFEKEDVAVEEVKVALTHQPTQEVKVVIDAGNTEQLEAYNSLNGTEYKLLPAEMYHVDKELVFAPGQSIRTLGVQVKDLVFDPAYTYALPLRISSSSQSIIESENEVLLVLEQRLKTKSLRIRRSGSERDGMFPDDFQVDNWTMEVMVNRSAYDTNNRAISGTKLVKGANMNDEIYVRFGDVTIKPNQLQMKTANSQIDVPAEAFSAKPDTWYMLTFRYNGKTNAIYVNGVKVAEREMRTGPYGLTGFWISGTNDLIREVRFWKSARTDKQIRQNIWKMVDSNDENLLLYCPMNGMKKDPESGAVTTDETKIWDWSRSQMHLDMPSGAEFVDNKGKPYLFPPQ